jgi:S-DNA-T family DNA segregation ATPase FtsK/SpoIIIE
MKSSIIEAGLIALFGGACVVSMYPDFWQWGAVMITAGAGGIAYQLMTYSKYDSIFRNLNLGKNEAYPIFKRSSQRETSVLYEFSLPKGLSVEEIELKHAAISQAVGKKIEIKYGYKNLLIEEFDETPTKYDYKTEQTKGKLGILCGYDRNGKLIDIDLASGEPHLLIAGETGSGKSTVLRSLITNLILVNDCDLFLIDLKRGAEFNIFQKSSKVKGFARTKPETESLLKEMSMEVDRRYDLFYDSDCVDIKHYNNTHKDKLKYQVIIIDEFADLVRKANSKDETVTALEELSAKARACGIHLIISTQRPDAQVINGRIKANVTSVLGLKTGDDTNSRIIIGKNGLENLRGEGHAILKRGEQIELQCPYLDIDRAQELIKFTYVNKVKTEEKTGEVDGFDFFNNLG